MIWRTLVFPVVLVPPVFQHRIRSFAEPFFIPSQIFQHGGKKEFLTIGSRMAERFQKASCHENGKLMLAKTEQPCGLLHGQTSRSHSQVEKSFYVRVHVILLR